MTELDRHKCNWKSFQFQSDKLDNNFPGAESRENNNLARIQTYLDSTIWSAKIKKNLKNTQPEVIEMIG